VYKQSYGSLASDNVAGAFKQLLVLLPSLTQDSAPDSVKPLRKSILYSRNLLDIFVYAYPYNSEQDDIWRDIRKLLNSGYESIGTFQDLSNVPYTDKDAKALRTPCLDWKEKLMKRTTTSNYLAFLRNPSYLKLYVRESSTLYSFWKDSNTTPDLRYSGLENLSRMTNGLFINLQNELTSLLALQDISQSENQIYFHHYRKLCRAIIYVIENFKLFLPNSPCNETMASDSIDRIYDKLGDLNDYYNEYKYYLKKDDKKNAVTSRDILLKNWESVKNWIKEDKFEEQIECLRSSLVLQ